MSKQVKATFWVCCNDNVENSVKFDKACQRCSHVPCEHCHYGAYPASFALQTSLQGEHPEQPPFGKPFHQPPELLPPQAEHLVVRYDGQSSATTQSRPSWPEHPQDPDYQIWVCHICGCDQNSLTILVPCLQCNHSCCNECSAY